MKITLNHKIDIEVQESGSIKETLCVFYRDFTSAEKKEQDKIISKYTDILKKVQDIGKKQIALDKKAALYELDKNYKKSIKCIEKSESLEDELKKLQKSLEDIGGMDQTQFAQTQAKKRFQMLVSGDDKEKLDKIAQAKGYASIMHQLDLAKNELEKKQYGE